MESHIKHKITSMFRSSFRSCKTNKNITDVVVDDKPVFQLQNNPMLFSDNFFPPKLPQSFDNHILFPRTKISDDQNSPLLDTTKRNTKMTRGRIRRLDFDGDKGYKGLFSSDDEEETAADDDDRATLFSSASFFSFSSSADSSESSRRRRAERIRRRRRRAARREKIAAAAAAKQEAADSLAVVKRSRDPYGDFRASMLEMIMEKQIFGAEDLQKLLECFLSLNSFHHHRLIIHVFTEICQALFNNFCP